MATVLDRVPVDQISDDARQVQVGRALLTVVAFIFWAIGFAAARAVGGIVWAGVAVRTGWREGRTWTPRSGPRARSA